MSPPEFPISTIDDPLTVAGKYFREGEDSCFLKAVTFGPFPAGSFPDEGKEQLRRIREELGANAIRVYEIPTLDFMHECAGVGLRVFITLPWSQHIDFLREREALAEADRLLLDTINRFRGHPALAGYFVANEIETTLVRWMGPRRVLEQLERLIDLGHANDAQALFSYANYPSTEYLLPCNQDFVSFNLYLETREELAGYLARLQNLAADKPLLITEFGIDSQAHGELKQAEVMEWHLEETFEAGCAGTTLFAWSDLWQRGGNTIEDWDFGMIRRNGVAKPVVDVVREKWAPIWSPGDDFSLESAPRVSVIVCTYRGSATLVACLDSLVALDYPDYEVILVNDGGDARVNELANAYDSVRRFSVEHGGLGAARNLGAEAASGAIFVYTDDDCVAEKDWLTWIVRQFDEDGVVGCAGGPNIPPPPETAKQALIAAAPGGPAHVLLTDTRAEHLPGCNLAVRREVFEEVGGFNSVFRTAGDDVDFCWRVMEAGYEIRFHAAAFVWHRRRLTHRGFFRQQIGYGRAEALLMPLHAERFRNLGGAVWQGRVYTAALPAGQIVYHGRYGYEPFQIVYPVAESGLAELTLHVAWWVLTLLLLVGGFFQPILFAPAGLAVAAAVKVAWSKASRAMIGREFDSFTTRLRLTGLILLQGIVRSAVRLRHGWRVISWTRSAGAIAGATVGKVATGWWKLGGEMTFWSEEGKTRDDLLAAIREAYPESRDDLGGKTDVIVREGVFWNRAVLTATEYHGGGKCLTRLRLLARPQLVTRLIVLPLLVAFPVAVWLGLGFQSEVLTLAAAYLGVEVVARVFMRMRIRAFRRIAESQGLQPV